MKKIRSSKKGFTLAELLIVVAIIGVLVGISIPIFTAQLEKSRLSTNQANARAAKAAAVAAYMDNEKVVGGTYYVETGVFKASESAVTAKITGDNISNWTTSTSDGASGTLGKTVYAEWTVALGDTDTTTAGDQIGVTGYACSGNLKGTT